MGRWWEDVHPFVCLLTHTEPCRVLGQGACAWQAITLGERICVCVLAVREGEDGRWVRTRLARRADGGEGRKEGRGRQDEDDIPESALFAFPDEELRPGPKEPIVAAAQAEVVVLLVDAIERPPPVFMTVKWRWRTRSEPPCCRLGEEDSFG